MPKQVLINIICAAVFLSGGKAVAQMEELQQIGRLIDDAIFFSGKYITPATDAAVYQAASGWVSTPQERKRWDFSLSLHTNIFFVPQSDRSFTVQNSDFRFFSLEQGTSASVPTALGSDDQVYLTGQLGNNQVRLETPEGIDREAVIYPYLQGTLAIGWGTELVVKYSPEVKLKRSEYQVYGFGIKHNFSRYIESLQHKKIFLSLLAAYSKEDVTFEFFNVNTAVGTLGIDSLNGLVDTWQLQVNGCKAIGSFEFMGGFIINTSKIKYKVGGERGSIEDIIPLRDVLNNRLKELYKTRTNYIGEASVKYNIGNFSIQSILAFGKFVNTNVSIQYLFI
ncbi:hypothetical protein CHU92_10820 [Flavobacterium cyanobacteriorum]|uniref:DUF5723 domain-containing protein n=1 Tax=Flavobacterium cyanobacteriorum TaxID=2022802 RepID=A0A255Z205_9FLAO|nr:DUF6588 family protein [Flavobacterium cyanobacteriorum]OYQ35461.1 hypothetical protein CHU92_10820 [Flavobacterium cyanobacteriorum]